ncbi:MAG TPA: response regulator transcription factor [Candidatus Scybalocola faecavium]|nr:response regulator transcription factor [Candidatus Scybalocola faecavium]
MIKLVIADDEPETVSHVQEIVEAVAEKNDYDIRVTTVGNGQFLKEDILEGKSYDIFLLDMEMPGCTGLELARLIQEKCGVVYIIFITNHGEYCTDGYEVGASRYILKDKLDEKLPSALEYVISQMIQLHGKYYVVNNTQGLTKVLYRDIIKIEKGSGKYSILYTRKGEYKTRSSLACLMNYFKTDEFIFINKGIIVNMNHVNGIDSNRMMKLSYGPDVEVSQSRIREVKKQLIQFYVHHNQ